jgi:DNA-binding NarL/FixJ family response regulator
VASRLQNRTRPIRVALRVADRALRARIIGACEDAGIAVADPDEAFGGVDVVLADHPVESAAPVIALASGEAHEAWPSDVRAVVPADIDAATLAAVVAVVAAGLVVMPHNAIADDDIADEDPDTWPDPVDDAGADELPIVLTPREREVLALLAEGASNKAIARALAVSVHTAKFHVASLTEKLGAHGRLEAIAIAIRSGLVMV